MSDVAVREAGTNKLTLVGIFSVWNCPAFPFQTPPFFISVFLSNLRQGVRELNLVVRIEQKKTGMVIANAVAKVQFGDGMAITPEAMVEIPEWIPLFGPSLESVWAIG